MAKDVKVAIIGDPSSFKKALTDTDAAASKFGDSTEGLTDKVKKFAAAAAGAFALKEGVEFLGASTKAAAEDAKQQAVLAKALENTTSANKDQIASVEAWINKVQNSTGVLDDDLRPALASLVGVTKDTTKAQGLLKLSMDVSAGSGKSLVEVTDAMSKAAAGNFKALKALSPALGDLIKDGASTEEVFAALATQFGGQTATAAATAEGKMAILKARFSGVQETIGGYLLPALTALATFVADKIIPAIQDFTKYLQEHRGVAIALGVAVSTVLVTAFIAWAASAAAAAAATIAAAAPVIAITAAIAALAAGIIYAYTHWGWFRSAVDAVASFMTNTLWPALKSITSFMTDTLIPTIGRVISWMVDFGQAVYNIAQKTVDVFVGIADVITAPFRAAFNGIARLWNSTVGSLSFETPDWIPGIGGKGFSVPKIPTLAQGGIAMAPTLAMIGDNGGRGEAVIPLDKLEQMLGGGQAVNIYLDGKIFYQAMVKHDRMAKSAVAA